MSRKSVFAVIAAIALVTLAGCSNGTQGGEVADEGPLVVYAPMEGPRAEWITEHAKKELDLDVTVVVGNGGDLASRLVAEKNNMQADVIVGLGEAQINTLAGEGILASYQPSWAPEIPENLRASSDKFTLYTQTPIVIAYNQASMPDAEAPTSWEDLADPVYKDKFVFPALTGQTGQAAIVGMLWPYIDEKSGSVSDEGWDMLKRVLDNAKPMAEGQAMDWAEVASGEMPIVVSWLGGIETAAKDNGITSMRVVSPAAGTPFVSTGVALTANDKHSSSGEKFLDWFGSASTQVAFVEATNNDTPLNPEALKELPASKASVEQVDKQPIDWTVVTPHLTEWMQKVQLEIVG